LSARTAWYNASMTDRRESGLRFIAVIVGIILVFAAFAGVLVFANIQRGPTFRVAFVVVESIPVGERLRSQHVTFESVTMQPALANMYVLEDEFPRYEGQIVLDNLRYGQALMKSHLISGQARSRYASFIEDPENVVLYVPLRNVTSIPRVTPGDYIDLWLVFGDAQNIADLMDPTPTPTPFAVETIGPLFLTPESLTPTPAPTDVIADDVIFATETPTPTATAIVRFPMADLLVRSALVIDLDKRPGREEGEADRVVGLTVVVNRNISTRLLFGINSGAKIVIGISAPNDGDPNVISPFPVPYDYEQFRIDTRSKISEAAKLGWFGPYQSGLWDVYLQAFSPDVYQSIQATRQAVLESVGRANLARPYALPTTTPRPTPAQP